MLKGCTCVHNRTAVITIVGCLLILYFAYTFNSCLMPGIHRTLKWVSVYHLLHKQGVLKLSSVGVGILTYLHFGASRITPYPVYCCCCWQYRWRGMMSSLDRNGSDAIDAEVNILGSIVRIVPLTGPVNGTEISPKYRFLKQNELQPNRRLPDALIIGVKKSGTRALLEFIRLHPDVRAAGCEVHFFDRHYGKGFHWYRNHMPSTIDGQITMEKTPSYFITRDVPQRVHHMNPGTK